MMRSLFALWIVLLNTSAALAQADTARVYTFGAAQGEEGKGIVATPDGGLIVVGATGSDAANLSQGYVLRVDAQLQCIWSKSFGGWGVDKLNDVVLHSDGYYYACGYSNSQLASDYAMWVIKFDEQGQLVWSKYYGGADWDLAYSLAIHPSTGIVVAGETYSNSAGGADALLLHISADGDVIQQASFGGQGNDGWRRVRNGLDGELLAVGYNESSSFPLRKGWMVRLDATFQPVFERFVGNEDQSVTISGITVSTDPNARALFYAAQRLDNSGFIKGSRAKLNYDTGDVFWIDEAELGGSYAWNDVLWYGADTVIYAGSTNVFGAGGADAQMTYNDGLSFLGGPTYGGNLDEVLYSAVLINDTAFAAVGVSNSLSTGLSQLLLGRWTKLVSGDYVQVFANDAGCYAVGIDQEMTNATERKKIKSEFYDLLGREVIDLNSVHGVLVECIIYDDGTIAFQKLFRVNAE